MDSINKRFKNKTMRKEEVIICVDCKGTGKIETKSRVALNDYETNFILCSNCGGSGRKYRFSIELPFTTSIRHKNEVSDKLMTLVKNYTINED